MSSHSSRHANDQAEDHTAATAEQIIALLQQRILSDSNNGHLRRDTHAKMYGVVKANFKVEANLPKELAKGIFSEPKEYQAWLRFSNQSTQINDDRQRDIRGLAIKLMGVTGPKLIDPDAFMESQDFILISPRNFIASSLNEFASMLAALQGKWWQKLCFFATHWGLDWALLRSMKRIANPLQIPYHSTTPYALDAQVVKYMCRPNSQIQDAIPGDAGPDFLSEAMRRQLAQGDVQFDFCVQVRNNPTTMSIENPRQIWYERASPWIKVASIRILRQEFDSPEQQLFGEKLSFNPWRCLEEHRPLGQINHARLLIYQAISKFRHEANHQDSSEPVDWNTM